MKIRYLLILSLLILCASAYADSASVDEAKEQVTPQVEGFDISHFNGAVDWKRVAQSKKHFVVLKATEGVDWVDPTFAEHWSASKASGLVRGAYHFFVAHDDPIQEADWYIKNVSLEKGDLPPIVDVERAEKSDLLEISKRLRTFIARLEAHFHAKPIIYTGPNFWNTYIKEPFEEHHLWVADYGVSEPVIPAGWKQWTFWQFTQQASLPGIEKAVDLNAFAGTRKELGQMLLGSRGSDANR